MDKSEEIDAIDLPNTRFASVWFMKRLNVPCTSLIEQSHVKINASRTEEVHILLSLH